MSRENRNLEAFVTQETVMMAAIMGSLKDAFSEKGYKATAPIFESSNFEYLEAAGNKSQVSEDN